MGRKSTRVFCEKILIHGNAQHEGWWLIKVQLQSNKAVFKGNCQGPLPDHPTLFNLISTMNDLLDSTGNHSFINFITCFLRVFQKLKGIHLYIHFYDFGRWMWKINIQQVSTVTDHLYFKKYLAANLKYSTVKFFIDIRFPPRAEKAFSR